MTKIITILLFELRRFTHLFSSLDYYRTLDRCPSILAPYRPPYLIIVLFQVKNLDRSHVFSVRFLKNTIKTEPREGGGGGGGGGGGPDQQVYDNMQVSAIVMLNQESGDSTKR